MPRKSPCNQVNPKKLAWLANRATQERNARETAALEERIAHLRERQHACTDLGMHGSRQWREATDELLATYAELSALQR